MPERWRAIYWIHRVRREMQFDTLQDAFDMLADGSGANELAIESIIDPVGCAISPADWGRLWAAREEEVEAPNAG